jgi:hypothetical protein
VQYNHFVGLTLTNKAFEEAFYIRVNLLTANDRHMLFGSKVKQLVTRESNGAILIVGDTKVLEGVAKVRGGIARQPARGLAHQIQERAEAQNDLLFSEQILLMPGKVAK